MILNVGAPAAGMNAAVRSAVRLLLYRGCHAFVAHNGFEGLVEGEVSQPLIFFNQIYANVYTIY